MREGNREIKKGKLIIAGIIVVAIIAIIVCLVIKKDDTQGGKEQTGDGQENVYELPDLTYSDMQVTNVEMEYLPDNNQTMVTFLINNTTQNNVSKESLTAYLIDSNEETVGQIKTYIEALAPGEQYSISVVMTGNLTSTAQIKLVKDPNQTTSTSAPAANPADGDTTDDETSNTTTNDTTNTVANTTNTTTNESNTVEDEEN